MQAVDKAVIVNLFILACPPPSVYSFSVPFPYGGNPEWRAQFVTPSWTRDRPGQSVRYAGSRTGRRFRRVASLAIGASLTGEPGLPGCETAKGGSTTRPWGRPMTFAMLTS